eukprot:gnl/TRDRNA2_/TRDRNA2_93852_c0_seq1.p1 gnl/TRDRNA2_/TRDRNA2_93852_c0~~gnl/TRDRNA2_/TRDRNA2_93852_c0_seq1.p1  ORF type:complete len:546 (-),score=89.07 gnl/TRDRNA2_/TRDRNA2_93852_c0_seq1:24-1661(-)
MRRPLLLWAAATASGEIRPSSADLPPEVHSGPFDIHFRDWDCMRIPKGQEVVRWSALFISLMDWLDRRQGPTEDKTSTDMGSMTLHAVPEVVALKEFSIAVEHAEDFSRAGQQCPIGLACICIVEAIALSSMHTEDVASRFKCIEELFAQTPIFVLAGSKWPLFKMMNLLWTMNKMSLREAVGYQNMNRFVQRQYADMVYSPEELAPFGIGRSVPWSSWLWTDPSGSGFRHARLEDMVIESRKLFNGFGPLIHALALAVWEAVEKDGRRERPVVRITLAFGSSWASLMPLAWARWAAFGFRAGIFVAMDEASSRACLEFKLICVPTGVASVLHKYTLAALAMHLGVDVLYCDLDAVPLGPDPLAFVHEVADMGGDDGLKADLVVSTHNYDCLNAGVWFARASGSTATFFLMLLQYLYEHWYEGDQRSFNALATGNVSVSFQQEVFDQGLPKLSVAVLSPDVVAGPDGFADAAAVRLFHAYKVYGEQKLQLVHALYGAHDLPPGASASRGDLHSWAFDKEAQLRISRRAVAVLKPLEGPRTSSGCW